MSGIRRWLFDNQRLTLSVGGSLCLVTVSGSLVAHVVGYHLVAGVLMAMCCLAAAAFAVTRAVLLRSPWRGSLAVGLGVLAAALLVPAGAGSWQWNVALLVLAAQAALIWPLWTPTVDPEDDEPGQDQVSRLEDTSAPAAAPGPKRGEPGFEYAPPPKR